MKELIEKIQNAYSAFTADAALQVEKGNKAAGNACPQGIAGSGEADEGVPQRVADLSAVRRLIFGRIRPWKGVRRSGVHLSFLRLYLRLSDLGLQNGTRAVISKRLYLKRCSAAIFRI